MDPFADWVFPVLTCSTTGILKAVVCAVLFVIKYVYRVHCCIWETGLDGAVAKTSANGQLGTGFVFRYQFKLRASF